MLPKVLVTRPTSQAQPLMVALSEAGFDPIAQPFIKIQLFNQSSKSNLVDRIRSTLAKIEQYDACIFISTNACDGFIYWLGLQHLSRLKSIRCFAIGHATCARLKHYGVNSVLTSQAMNSEALLELDELKTVKNKRILIVRGEGGRNYLRNVLQQREATVDYLEVYRRQKLQYNSPVLQPILALGLTMVMISSEETLLQLLEQANLENIKKELQRLPLIVSSQRLSESAKSAGFHHIYLAANAGVEAMVEATQIYGKLRNNNND